MFPQVGIIFRSGEIGRSEDAAVSPSLSPAPPVAACQAFLLIEMQGWPLWPSAEPSAPEGTFPSFPPPPGAACGAILQPLHFTTAQRQMHQSFQGMGT